MQWRKSWACSLFFFFDRWNDINCYCPKSLNWRNKKKKSYHNVWTKDSAAAFISYPFPFNSISPFNNCWRLQIKLLMLLSSSSSNLQTKIHIFYWTFQSSYVFSGAKTPNKPKMVLLLSGINAVPTNLTCTVCTRIDVLVHTVSPSIRCHSWLNRLYKIQLKFK